MNDKDRDKSRRWDNGTPGIAGDTTETDRFVREPVVKREEELHKALRGVELFKSELVGYHEELNKIREELESYRARYRHLFEFSPIGYFGLDIDGVILEANRAAVEMLIYERESVVGKPFRSFIAESSRSIADAHLARRDAQSDSTMGVASQFEITLLARDGNEIPALARVILVDSSLPDMPHVLVTATDITDIKDTQRALHESEEKHRLIVENVNEAIIVATETMLEYINPKGYDISGYTEEDLTSRPFIEFIHPDDRERVVEFHLRGLKGEYDTTYITYRIFDKAHNIRWMRANSTLIQWNGKPAALTFMDDITTLKEAQDALEKTKDELELKVQERTAELNELNVLLQKELAERKRIGEALRESEQNYLTVVENSEQGIVVGQGPILKFANRKMSVMTGYTIEEILSMPFLNFIHPDDHEKVMKRYLGGLEGKEEPHTFTHYRIMCKDGRIICVEENGTLITWDGKAATLVFATDITEKLEIEQALRESEKKYRNLFETSREVVFLSTVDGRIIDINRAGEELLGHTRDELTEMDVADVIVDPPCRKGYPELIAEQGFVKDFPLTLRRKDGALIDCLMTSTIIKGPNDEVTGYQGIIKDITDQKRFLDITFDSIADGVYAVDSKWEITMFNAAAEKITGVSRKDAIGRKCTDVFHSSMCGENCAIIGSMKTGRPVARPLINVVNDKGAMIPVSIYATVLRDKDGNVRGGVTTFRDLTVIEELKKEIGEKYTFKDIVSKNKRIREIFDILPDIAESDSTVLIEGRSGTGKELFAKAIHGLSRRKSRPFVAINCAALPETLLESELFGYVKGAFTNAVADKPGRFALAEGGTVFLDEISELSPALQVKLLRVLQEREYEPLGSVKSKRADVRIIASTNRTITQEVAKGSFREDLYYRLNIVKIALPDLRERKEDIPLLVDHFISKMSIKKDKDIRGVSDEVMNLLMSYDYPGNVRELENIIEHAFVLCRGVIITSEHLPKEFLGDARSSTNSGRPVVDELSAAERRIIEETLLRYDGNKSKAAQALNMGRTTLWRKIKEYGLE